jgi:glutathione synthase/RimK-type ligase-like ATP-grasp enzyme
VQASAAEVRQIAYEWSEAIEGFLSHIPIDRWINHPSRNSLASHKMEQLTRAKAAGLAIPETLVTQDSGALRAFWDECGGAVVVKPLGCGYIERDDAGEDSNIYTNSVGLEDIAALDDLPNCPTLFQRKIDKATDIRVVIIGQETTAVAIQGIEADGRQRVDIRRNNMADVEYKLIDLPAALREKLLRIMGSYGLTFAAIDMAIDANGQYVFFEINPNGQWAWLDLAGACDIAGCFVRHFSQQHVNG